MSGRGMNTHHTTRIALAAALLLGTLLMAQDVKTDYDRGVDFTRYKTFSWERIQTQGSTVRQVTFI